MTAKVRLSAIEAFISAWRRNCTPYTAKNAAKITGTYSPNVKKALNSIFVHELSPEEQERYNKRIERLEHLIKISGQVITEPEKNFSLADSIGKIHKFVHLCNMNYASQKCYFEMVNDAISSPHSNSYLLSEMPSFPTIYYVF